MKARTYITLLSLLFIFGISAASAEEHAATSKGCPVSYSDSYSWGVDIIPGSGKTIALAHADAKQECKAYNVSQSAVATQIIASFTCPEECPNKATSANSTTNCMDTTIKVSCDRSVEGQKAMIEYCKRTGMLKLFRDVERCIDFICGSGDVFTYDLAAGSVNFSIFCY